MTADESLTLNFIIGCTASGKSAAAFELARRIEAELICVDSMKVYRGMDIGTAKPGTEKREQVPHHLIDVADPSEEFNVARYVELADAAARDIAGRHRPIICVGGTALYIKSLSQGLFEGPGESAEIRRRLRQEAEELGVEALHARLSSFDPEAAQRIHRNDYRRIERALEVYEISGQRISTLQTQWSATHYRHNCRFVGLRRDKQEQSRRINERVRRMMDEGLLEEVRGLLERSCPMSKQASQAVGYVELIDHLAGRIALDDAIERIKINSRRLAKSQRTWFKRFSDVTWIDVTETDTLDAVVGQIKSWYDSAP